MAENTKIAWCDHTFNAWWGCDRVSPACDDCYAAAWAHRLGMDNLWLGDRRFFGDAHWREPLKWARKANGTRPRVFTNSMADVFDNHEDVGPARWKLWNLIRSTPELDWLLLTKRIGNARRMLPEDWGRGYPNVWLGITVVNQEEADRDIQKLLAIPAVVRFVSMEPLLEAVTVPRFVDLHHDVRGDFPIGHMAIAQSGLHVVKRNLYGARSVLAENDSWLGIKPSECTDVDLNWVIVGGESGSRARPMEFEWARSLRDQCRAAGTAFFMKQLSQAGRSWFKNFEAFPEDLQVREWPRSAEPQPAPHAAEQDTK